MMIWNERQERMSADERQQQQSERLRTQVARIY